MKRVFLLLNFLSCVILSVAQNTYDAPEIIFKDGHEYQSLTSENLYIIASLNTGAPLRGFDKNPIIEIFVKNYGSSPVLFDPMNISATFINGTKQKNIDIYSQKQITSKVDKKIKWFGPNDKQNVQVTTNIEHKNQYGVTTSTTKGTTTTQVYTGEGSEERAQASHYINEMYLKKNSIMPGEHISGIVIADKIKKGKLIVTIKVGEDKFLYSFDMND